MISNDSLVFPHVKSVQVNAAILGLMAYSTRDAMYLFFSFNNHAPPFVKVACNDESSVEKHCVQIPSRVVPIGITHHHKVFVAGDFGPAIYDTIAHRAFLAAIFVQVSGFHKSAQILEGLSG